MSSDTTPRILISRMSAIGDTILTLPVACALREHLPDAYIGWVVEKKSAPMVRNHSTLDAVIELERGWFTSFRGIRNARKLLRSYNFDVTIDCQGLTKSALAGWLSGAPKRIGLSGRHGCELSRVFNNTLVQPVFTHVVDRSLELLIPLEVHSPKVRWKLPIPPTARTWANRWRRTIACPKLAVLNPGATWDSRLWEADRFGETANYLMNTYGYRSVVVWGTPKERAMAAEIVMHSGGAATLAPDTDLHHLAALIETADLFLSADTGPLHMAVAMGTATIGLYGATRPGDSGPYGQISIQKAYESGTRRHRRAADNTAMKAIQVSDVCKAIDSIEAKRRMIEAAA
ncbi:MAG: glycosyltransferase family 9 protein [Rubripirellula sp.]